MANIQDSHQTAEAKVNSQGRIIIPNKPLPIDSRTFWNIDKHDPSGFAWKLYSFYVQKAIDQNSPQPWATDLFCARRLRRDKKTVINARQALEAAKVIKLIRKRRSNYIRVHYMTDRIKGPSVNMSTKNIPEELMGTYMVFDFYTVWFESIKFYKNFSRFQRDVHARLGYQVDKEDIVYKMEKAWDKINETGYPIVKVNNELSFYGYVLRCVVNKFKDGN